jgi:chorismate mutase-like protein
MRWIFLFLWSATAPLALCASCCGQQTMPVPRDAGRAATLQRERDLTAAVDRLWGLLRRRAELSVEVAKWKWNAKAPILDRAREQRLLDAMTAAARARGIDPLLVGSVFRAQLEASRAVQANLFAKWKAEGVITHAKVEDLATTLRPALDQTGKQILDVLEQLDPVRDSLQLREAVEKRMARASHDSVWTPGIERTAFLPLLKTRAGMPAGAGTAR